MEPATRYARSGGVSIAYQVVGEGPLDLVWIPSMAHHVELNWENPMVARFLHRLGSIARVLVFDKRGTGMSDRLAGSETLEERMDDIRAVMDAVGSERRWSRVSATRARFRCCSRLPPGANVGPGADP